MLARGKRTNQNSSKNIKVAVQRKVFFENRQRMLESRKVRDRLDDEETFGLEREKTLYLDRLPLHKTRVMFRFRASAMIMIFDI